MKQVGYFFLFLAATALTTGAANAQAGHYELVNLGAFVEGGSSNGHAINNLGEVTGRSMTEQWYYRAFFWSESTGMVNVRTLGGPESEGWGINDHSQVVGETTDRFGQWHAFLWEAGVIQSAYTAGYGSGAWTINNDGLIVGWNDSIFGTAGFVRHPDGTVYLGEPGSEFYDINDPAEGANALAGGYWHNTTSGLQSPVAYDTGLNTPSVSPNGGIARGVNRDGTLAGYQGSLPIFAKQSSGYVTQVAPLVEGYDSGRFFKINDAGLMVGQNRSPSLPGIGVMYAEDGEVMDINTLLDVATRAAWQVDTLRDANDHGYLTGTGTLGSRSLAVLLRPLDADGDGLDYYEEAYLHATDPDVADMDGDGLSDGEEIERGTSPTDSDSDGDGILDGTEVASGTDPLDAASVPSDVYVDGASGSDSIGLGTQSAPWATVANAVASVTGTAENTVSIRIAEGVYTHLNAAGGALVLNSYEHLLGGYEAAGWTRDVAANETILDASVAANGAPAPNAVVLNGVADVVLDGLTIMGAYTAAGGPINAAGVLVIDSDQTASIRNCRIQFNTTGYNGSGGIRLIDSSPLITRCTIVQNYTDGVGGGIYMTGDSQPAIEKSLIGGNQANSGGGGVCAGGNSISRITNCVIVGNDSNNWFGGGIRLSGAPGTVVANTTLAYNDGESGGGGGVYVTSDSRFVNCIFAGNRNFAVSDWSDGGLNLEQCLFYANFHGDYTAPVRGGVIVQNGAAAINSQVTGATGNLDGNPAFQVTGGTWTAPRTYNSATGRTTLTDAAASFVPGELKGRLIVLTPSQTYQRVIIDNTATTIILSGTVPSSITTGSAYRFIDYHLQPGSAAIDMGIDTSAPEDGAVTLDFDGVLRGFDGDGLGAATADGSDYDIGAYESDFPIVPTITVTSPNGGELIPRGSVYNITWSSTGLLGPNVKVIVRKGLAFGVLSNSTPNDGSFAWSVPANTPTDANFLIEVVSTMDPAILDRSDAFFTITPGVPTGTLTVTAPNGGESYLQGATVPIAWTSTGTPGANVDILARRGASSIVLTSATPNDGAFNWIVPTDQAPGTDYVIEVRSSTTPAITDSSNAPFSITVPPTLLLTAPNGGESYLPGATVPITWTNTGAVGTIVQILAHGAGQTFSIDDAATNDGAYDWVIPANQLVGTDYTIQVRSLSNPAIGDASNGPFTIQATAPADSLTLLSPNGGEAFLRGTAMPITWRSTGNVGTSVKIVLRRGAYSGILFGGTPNDGVHQWSIPANYPVGTGYTLEISSTSNPAIGDVIDAPFSITDTPPSASIVVTAPNGGENYLPGATVPITWTNTGAVGTIVQILAHGAGQTFSVDDGTTNDGAFDWVIPANQPTGANYTIEVRSVLTPTITDSSNAPFAINAAPPSAAITLTDPNGGETYYHGGIVPITWTSTGATGAEVLIVAHSAGQPHIITTATANDGEYQWTVPAGQPTGADYVITVRSLTVPNTGDSSDAPFSIAAAPTDSITLVTPNGGETFTRGGTVEFRWNSTGNVGNAIKIVLRRGTYVGTLFGGTPNDGVHNWTIPANYPTGPGFTIEISSVANPAIGDASDGSFSIAAP